jgi:YHS domain-containing protein
MMVVVFQRSPTFQGKATTKCVTARCKAAMFIDTVCGMDVKPEPPNETSVEGKRNRFCSAKRKAKFEAGPQRYLTPRRRACKNGAPG